MAWSVGLDEAGYGPNLGPFVMTAVAVAVPDEWVGADLWGALAGVVCKAADAGCGRVVVDDSKAVHALPRGLVALERGVLALVGDQGAHRTLADLVARWAVDGAALAGEAWYRGTSAVPAHGDWPAAAPLPEAVGFELVRTAVVCPPRFNALAEAANSKGAVLGHCLGRLLGDVLSTLPEGEAVAVAVDKHGGRNTYAAMLQDALPGGMVVAVEEGARRSRYRVVGLGRELTVTFEPRADGAYLPVALASMASKYLRELFMAEFNAFWQGHVPGLKATAGYPGDAARYLAAIRPAMARLGIDEAAVWRKR